jgi:nucleotide-binding universal stress UspA family protein
MGYHRVVVGTDGSKTAAMAVEQAAELAMSFDAELLIVTAFVSHPSLDKGADGVPDDIRWQITDSAVAEGHAVKASEIAARVGLGRQKVHAISERGDPSDALIRVAEERGGDLIVVGSKGMSSASRFLLGSVPNKVSHHAPCDVVIVRTAD